VKSITHQTAVTSEDLKAKILCFDSETEHRNTKDQKGAEIA
jgi:hypothetical protein